MNIKKTILALTALSTVVTAMSVAVNAANYWTEDVVVEAGYGTATVDGVFDPAEWLTAQEIPVTLDDPTVIQYGEYQGGWADGRDPADFSTWMYFMWDEEALYICEQRFDDYIELGGTGEAPWNIGDGNLIFIQTIDGLTAGNEDAWSHHVFYIVGDGTDSGKYGGDAWVRICDGSVNSQETVKYDEIQIATAPVADGFCVEVKVPWSVFGNEIPSFVPAEGAKIGMSMVPIDFDEDGEFAQLSWVKQADQLGVSGGYDYGGWATMTLAAAPVVEEVPEEAPVEVPADTPDAETPVTADAGIVVSAAVMAAAAGIVLRKKN